MTFPTVPVTRRRAAASTTDAYGNPIPSAPVDTPLPAALFAPNGLGEQPDVGRVTVIDQPTCYWAHAWPEVLEHDQLIVAGDVYDVDGTPASWPGGGLVVRLRKAA